MGQFREFLLVRRFERSERVPCEELPWVSGGRVVVLEAGFPFLFGGLEGLGGVAAHFGKGHGTLEEERKGGLEAPVVKLEELAEVVPGQFRGDGGEAEGFVRIPWDKDGFGGGKIRFGAEDEVGNPCA